jgi:hypothetical protein
LFHIPCFIFLVSCSLFHVSCSMLAQRGERNAIIKAKLRYRDLNISVRIAG